MHSQQGIRSQGLNTVTRFPDGYGCLTGPISGVLTGLAMP